MHEFSLVTNLLEQVEAIRREQNGGRVVSIQVCVGEFSGVEADLFRSAYEILIEDSHLRGAKLQMTREPLSGRCEICGFNFAIERFRFECPECKSREVTISGGERLILESVTLEQEDDAPSGNASLD